MSTQIKRKIEPMGSPARTEEDYSWESLVVERHLMGYQFLRNTWGSYFHLRPSMDLEDKFDHVNKIVGMVKAQVKMMTLKEAEPSYAGQHTIAGEQAEKMREALERSHMHREELGQALTEKDEQIIRLRQENEQLREQVAAVKLSKCQAQQRIIELSNSVYQLEMRQTPFIHASGKNGFPTHDTLAQFSALTEEESGAKPKHQLVVPKFKLTKLLDHEDDDLCLSEDDGHDPDELKERSPNLPLTQRNPLKATLLPQQSQNRPSHPLKVSMPVGKAYEGMAREMVKAQLQTERMYEIDNLIHGYRKTLPPKTKLTNKQNEVLRRRRFQRIR